MKTKDEVLQLININNEFKDYVSDIIAECFSITKEYYNAGSLYLDEINNILPGDEFIDVQYTGAYSSQGEFYIPIWVLWEINYKERYLQYLIDSTKEKEEEKRQKEIESARLMEDYVELYNKMKQEEKYQFYKRLKEEFENEES